MDRQINILQNNWIEKQEEGFELIENRYRPSKLKTLYQQILQLDDSIQKLVNKKTETLRDPDISLKRKLETEKYFQNLNAEWLPYIHGETNMSSQQSQSTLHANEEQPPANNVHQNKTLEFQSSTKTMVTQAMQRRIRLHGQSTRIQKTLRKHLQ